MAQKQAIFKQQVKAFLRKAACSGLIQRHAGEICLMPNTAKW